jgi:hypothetical protein
MGGSLVPPDDDDHNSGFKAQDAKLAALMARIEDLERRDTRAQGLEAPSGHATVVARASGDRRQACRRRRAVKRGAAGRGHGHVFRALARA